MSDSAEIMPMNDSLSPGVSHGLVVWWAAQPYQIVSEPTDKRDENAASVVMVPEDRPVIGLAGYAKRHAPHRGAGGGTEGASPCRGAVGMVDDEVEGVAERVPQVGGLRVGLDLVECFGGLPGVVDDRPGHGRRCGLGRVVP